MSKRKIITIDAEKCTGCGLCVPNCPEGALQIIDGKARLVSDLFCDGLGACLGHCPEGAITVEEREAVPYDERKVMENIIKQGDNTIAAHLEHLEAHGEKTLFGQAVSYLKEKGLEVPEGFEAEDAEAAHAGHLHAGSGCPGSRHMEIAAGSGSRKTQGPGGPGRADAGAGGVEGARAAASAAGSAPGAPAAVAQPSALANWPIQLHLISPTSPLFQGKDILLAADCTAYASGGFHDEWLGGKVLAIACPKLDEGTEIYKEKITAMIDHARINTLTVLMMEVPCCRGLLSIAQEARRAAHRNIPLKAVILGIPGPWRALGGRGPGGPGALQGGGVLSEEWVEQA